MEKKNLTEKKDKHLWEYGNVFHTCFPHESGSILCTDTSCRLAPTCGAKPSVSTAQSHEKHREKPRRTAGIPGTTVQDTISQHFSPPGHQGAATFAQHFENFIWTRKGLPGVGPTRVWRSTNTSAESQQPHSARPCASCRAGTGKHGLV